MRTNRCRRYAILAFELALAGTVAQVFAGAATAAGGPLPVSPGGKGRGAVVEARCPTFHWAGVPGAGGYELAVFRLPEGEADDGVAPAAEPVLVTRASVPGDARGFTPSSADCLERGRRYAWSVAAAGDAAAKGGAGELRWSQPFLFEVGSAPSLEDVEQAIATLQRYREQHPGDGTPAAAGTAAATVSASPDAAAEEPSNQAPLRTRSPRQPLAHDGPLPGPLSAPTSGVVRVASAAAPSLGNPSLRVGANVALGASSSLFKDNEVFLWDDDFGNTALGRNALASANGTTFHNTAVGRDALRYTVQGVSSFHGTRNTAVGRHALISNSTGYRNTASGYAAHLSNTTGFHNTANGTGALSSNTTGSFNTASGYRALLSNTIGGGNTANGTRALYANTTGGFNTASGYRALHLNTTGSRNTANGSLALYANFIGSGNTASGTRALFLNSTGNFDTASGYRALHLNTTGSENTASGTRALYRNTTGKYNTASGYRTLYANTTGYRNTAVGWKAGVIATTGSDNIFVGSGAYGTAGEANTIRIGGTATGSDTPGRQNRAFINGIRGITTGESNPVALLIDNAGQLGTVSSSRAVKQDIEDLGAFADRLLELRPVAFRYKQHAAGDPDTPLQFGLIAEEVAEVFPELVVFDEEGRPETVKYDLLDSLLLRELQNRQGVLERQQAENQRQQTELRLLRARLDSIEEELRELGGPDGGPGSGL